MATATATRLDQELVSEVERWLPTALVGDERAARRYARAWHELVRAICSSDPRAPASAVDVLDHMALTAPFNPDGPLRALVSVASGIMPGMDVPTIPRTARKAPPASVDYQRFARVVLAELSGAGTGLEHLMAAWGLTVTEVAGLFGVRRQAVQQWLDEGVPGARQPKLHTILETADLLEWNLLPERIPGIVRTPSAAYGGRSMLELIANDRQDELLQSVRRSFDWAWSA
jgi:hypothetical protein